MNLNKQSDQINQLDDITTLTNVSTEDSTPNIIWNENEETFLQNLLANTLLSDDLVEKTDLDLGLGFDNLQLNYDSSSTEPLPNQLTIVSLEDPVQSDLLPKQNLILSDPDDNLFKKPSNDFLTVNGHKSKKKSTFTSTSAQNSESTKTKRSVKRSKISNRSNQESILSKSAPVSKNFKHRISNSTGCNGQNFLKFTHSKNSKQHNKKSQKISSSLSSSDSVSLKPDKDIFGLNQSNMLRRDEFDLQIKELSLLDLHSSEDDSSQQDPNNQKIPVRKTNSKTELTKDEHGNLSEIAKRIKYSQNTHEQTYESGNGCKQKLDKFIKYFKSLDSTEKGSSAKKSLDSLLSPPSPSNHKIQNKRKKKEVTESPSSPVVFISVEQPTIPDSTFSLNLENDTLLHMKNLDINTEQDNSLNLDIRNKNSRSYLWNLLKENSTHEELTEYLGSSLHDKISFWDLVQLKLKYSKSNHLKTIYEIIDDYTKLYSNMSTLLERFVNEQSTINSLISKSENSSRSRSSSRNIRKQSSNSLNR